MINDPIYLTEEGLHKIRAEYLFLAKVKRGELAKRLYQASEWGNLSENVEYEAACEERQLVERRIAELRGLLNSSKIIKKRGGGDFVRIGSTVLVGVGRRRDEFKIVGTPEANPLQGAISCHSPVGRALLGAKIGEVVEVKTPVGKCLYKVLEIN